MLRVDDSKTITIPAKKYWDNQNGRYVTSPETTIKLEHSLTSIQIWEGIHKKAFLKEEPKTNDEMLSYIKCMTITKNVPPIVYTSLSPQNVQDINKYIEDTRTASVVNSSGGEEGGDVPTAEVILYWMITLNIPMEAKSWHLSRLLSLVKVLSIKNKPKSKSSPGDIRKNHAAKKAAARRRRR